MKKLFLVNVLILITLVSCSTITTKEQDQIKNSALLLGETYRASGQYSEALNVYNLALDEVSDYRLNYNKAATLALLERYDEALEFCRYSFSLYPEIISFKQLELSILKIHGSTDSVILCSQEILQMDPADTDTALYLMQLYTESEMTSEAYLLAVDLFRRGITDNSVLTVLYEYDSASWEEVYNLLFIKTE
ncbi:MAG: hypothetical protein K6F82_05935 [Sphaerochaetaceae bacterium]|nr:hypothetical protein [Sphaerochaetaceae bacterium]